MARGEIVGIGECMLELREDGRGGLALGFGGDVLNTLVYAARDGMLARFATITGGGHYGRWLKTRWQEEGVNCDLVAMDESVEPPMYLIRTDDAGERRFHYWRAATPFRGLLARHEVVAGIEAAAARGAWLYLSAISLALLDDADRLALLKLLDAARLAGATIVFDPNFRPRLWPSAAVAKRWVDQAYACSTIAMPSLEDERLMASNGNLTPADIAASAMALGSEEVVVKNGAHGVELHQISTPAAQIEAERVARVVDTTSAGDAFNAAYIAARARGEAGVDAAAAGARLAAHVVQFRGAIVPQEARGSG